MGAGFMCINSLPYKKVSSLRPIPPILIGITLIIEEIKKIIPRFISLVFIPSESNIKINTIP